MDFIRSDFLQNAYFSYLKFDHKGVLSLNLTSSAWLPNYCIQVNVDEWMKCEITVHFSDPWLIDFEF